MSRIDALLKDIEGAGIRLRLDPPDLVVKPSERLTPQLEARLKAHKAELVRRLEAELQMVLDTMISIGTWKTTRQIAKAVNLPVDQVLPVLETLFKAGSVDRSPGPIFIWKAATSGSHGRQYQVYE